MVRKQLGVLRDADQEVQIIVLGQHQRLDVFVMAVQVVYDRFFRSRLEAIRVVENGGYIFGEVVPAAQLPVGSFPGRT